MTPGIFTFAPAPHWIAKSFAALLMIIAPGVCCAQDNCGNALTQANKYYESGKFSEAIAEITPCMEVGANKTELWQGYKLLTLCYIYLENKDKARESAEYMLEINPFYKVNLLEDPKEFITLVRSITIIPKFSVGFSATLGLNTTQPVKMRDHNVSDIEKKYKARNGYQFGAFVGYHFRANLMIESGLFASVKNYRVNYAVMGWEIEGTERLSYLEAPLSLKYAFGNRRLQPFVNFGAYGGYLTSGAGSFKRNYLKTDEEFSSEDISSMDRRKKLNAGLLFGAGANYRMGPGSLVLSYRYCRGLTNIADAGSRYSNTELLYNFYYLDDDMRLNNSIVSLGYSYYVAYRVLKKQKKWMGVF